MESAKETVYNVAASANSGMEKTKATLQEKTERMTTSDPVQKEMATEKKEQRINEAELQKQQIRQHNAATKQATALGGQAAGYSAGGQVTEQYPTAGTGTGTGTGAVKPQTPNTGGGARTGYGGSGATY